MKKRVCLLALLIISSICILVGCGNDKGESVSRGVESTTEPIASATMMPTDTPTPTPEDIYLPESPKTEIPELKDVSEQYKAYQDSLNVFVRSVVDSKDQPAINITTFENEQITSKDKYVAAIIDVFNCDEKYRVTAEGGVKVRGNSTADDSQKPYRIKFTKEISMLGLNNNTAHKSWVLLKPYWNLCPDMLAFEAYKIISDNKYYSSDALFVHVYVNEKYKGLYLLCEQNQVDENRVDVYEPKKDETTTDIGYFLEIDNYPGDDKPYFTMDYKKRAIKDFLDEERTVPADDITIRSNIYTKEQLARISTYMENAYEIIYAACVDNKACVVNEQGELVETTELTPKEAVEAIIDLDSVVYMYILEELMQNYDVGAGSFYMAVDFSENSKLKKLTFLAPWDFNWAGYESVNKGFFAGTWQKLMDETDRSNIWFITFMRAEWFRKMVKARVDELTEADKYKNELKPFEEYLDTLRADLGGDSWKVDKGIEYCKYTRNRLKYLKEHL